MGWTRPIHLHDADGISDAWGVQGVPHCVLINTNGEIQWKGHPMSIPLEEKINDLLNGNWPMGPIAAEGVPACPDRHELKKFNAVFANGRGEGGLACDKC